MEQDTKTLDVEFAPLRAVILGLYLYEKTGEERAAAHYERLTENRDYLIYTDDEANIATTQYITETLWAFPSEWLAHYINAGALDSADRDELNRSIEAVQETCCENANGLLLAAVSDNLGKLIRDAEATNGRGDFLAGYDGEEGDVMYDGETYYIYRCN